MKCEIVAELGINCNGNIEIAKKMIFEAHKAGCDYVKFQKRDIDLVYTKEELDKPRESPWGTTTRDQKQGLEFNKEQYNDIDKYCKEIGIKWFASPWDVNSVEFLMQYDNDYTKIASASITDFNLLSAIKNTQRPVIISTGMSTKKEIDAAVNFLGNQVKYILACTSTYPTPTSEMNLKFIKTLKIEYPDKKIGFSNHHPGILFTATSVVMGAEMVEFHLTLDRSMYGSDQAASIEVPGMCKIVDYIRELDIAMGSGEWIVFPSEEKVKQKLRRI